MIHKIVTIVILILSCSFADAQIAVGKENVDGANTLLDFGSSGNTRGIILPAVTELPENPANGTFVFDVTDSTVKVYYLDDQDVADWHDLTGLESPGNSEQVDIDHLTNTPESGEGTIIGDGGSGEEGVLVLDSPDKAMILPKIASPHINVKSPYPGMMCYDTITKSLAVFDGSKWYFWR